MADALHPAKGDVDLEVAFHESRAAALGRSGRALERSLAAYRRAVAAGASRATVSVLLDEVAAQTYRLVLQRECAGARTGNLEAIRDAYDLPEAVLRRL